MSQQETYTIRQAAEITGLPSSTLRYYESVGIGPAIRRDPSSGHRVYTGQDLDTLGWVACLAATGMGIAELKEYFSTKGQKLPSPADQVKLLQTQDRQLEAETQKIELRRRYLALKISYWQALEAKEIGKAGQLAEQAKTLAQDLR